MIHIIYIYLMFNCLFVGAYFMDNFNGDSIEKRIFIILGIFMFAAPALLFGKQIDYIKDNWLEWSIGFWLALNVFKRYDNMEQWQIDMLKRDYEAISPRNKKRTLRIFQRPQTLQIFTSQEDYRIFFEALESPKPPNQKLKNAYQNYTTWKI